MRDEGVAIRDVEAIRFTDKAMLVRFKNGVEKWIPQSVVHDDSEVFNESNRAGKLIVKLWWADREGLT